MAKREFQEIGIKNSNDFPLIGTSLASVESLSMPLVCIFIYFILGYGHSHIGDRLFRIFSF
jgi:hypothetical protein